MHVIAERTVLKQTDKGVSQGLFGDGRPVGWGAVESRGGIPKVVSEERGIDLIVMVMVVVVVVVVVLMMMMMKTLIMAMKASNYEQL